jgi:hypothetical protein
MTNEERIYELCECLMIMMEFLDGDYRRNIALAGVMDVIKDIRQDIDNS